jgi:hypothetical protein
MSIQIGSSTLTTYRNFKEQLVLTTASSNLPILSLDSSHASNNVLIRTGKYVIGQSNNDFLFGYSNAGTACNNRYTPAFQFLDNSKIIKFYHNIDATNINSVIGNLNVLSNINVPQILTSNITIVFNNNNALQPEFIVKTPQSNLFVVNGYNNHNYFTGNLGIGTTTPVARLHTLGFRADGASRLENISLDSISFNNWPGTTMFIDAGIVRVTRDTLFENNVNIQGNLQVKAFEIVNLNTNAGNFKGLVTVNNSLFVHNSSNEYPSLHIHRNYLEGDDFFGSNLGSNLQPIVQIDYTNNSQTQRVFTIDPNGRIGIGTTNPSRLLDIYTFSNAELGSNKGMFGIQGDRPEEVFCIDCNAFIGIGTTTPRYYFDILMHSNSFEYTKVPTFINIQKNNTPVLWLNSNGNFGIHTSNTKNHVALKVNGVFETDFLSVHRIIPVEGPDVHFTNCNIDAVNNLNASNAFIQLIHTSNIYADYITASNYNLLAFNSYLSTKELEFELDDLLFTGNTFILSKNYPTYFDKIGGTNAFGGLEGTTDPTLSNKPTDKINIAKSGKIHIIAEDTYTNTNNDTQFPTINNGLVITTSNMFSNINNQDVIPFVHIDGNGIPGTGKKRIGGYSIGLTNPIISGDSMARITLEQNPVEAQSVIDTCVMSIKPYNNSERRIGWRYNYTYDTLRVPKLFITNSVITESETISDNNIVNNGNYALFAKGNVRFDAPVGNRTIFHAMHNTNTNKITFSIGQSLATTSDNSLEVNGNTKITDNTLIQGVLTVNSNIYAKSVISQTSDARLKENLKIIDKPLEKINQLTGYTFDRIDLKTRDAGLIAQDVLNVLPEIVSQSDDGYYSLAYANMAGLFVESIKTLVQRIEHLEKQVQTLSQSQERS